MCDCECAWVWCGCVFAGIDQPLRWRTSDGERTNLRNLLLFSLSSWDQTEAILGSNWGSGRPSLPAFCSWAILLALPHVCSISSVLSDLPGVGVFLRPLVLMTPQLQLAVLSVPYTGVWRTRWEGGDTPERGKAPFVIWVTECHV